MMTILASNLGTGRSRNRSAFLLDQYLNRIGHQTWAGYLSREGLEQLIEELRDGATRNTAVQLLHEHAHRFETIAMVGNTKRFGGGLVSVGKVLARTRSHPPVARRLLRRLTEVAALWHDVGKSFEDFQGMVRETVTGKHRLRHFTVSYFAYLAWARSNEDLTALAFCPTASDDWQPGGMIPTTALAAAIVLTHHGKTAASSQAARFTLPTARFGSDVGKRAWQDIDLAPLGSHWRDACHQKQDGLNAIQDELPAAALSLAFYVCRAAMMLADHAQSSHERTPAYKGAKHETPRPGIPYAKSSPYIPLEDHLLGVMKLSGSALNAFTGHAWPTLARRPESLARRPHGVFAWQYRAEVAIRDQALKPGDGFFGVVLAETGTGKTQGNYRIMDALSDGAPRFTLGLGYGALAIQSGIEYRRELGLSSDECTVFVGRRHRAASWEAYASLQDLEFNFVGLGLEGIVDKRMPKAVDLAVGKDGAKKRMLSTPIVAMTIEHIMAAMEADRGSFVPAALRVATSDLAVDEIDSFGLSELHAIGRLLYVSGLYGRRVLISSATVTPEISRGLFQAYRAGYAQHQALADSGRCHIGFFSNGGDQASVTGFEGGGDAYAKAFKEFATPIARSKTATETQHLRRLTSFPLEPRPSLSDLFEAISGEAIRLATAHGKPLRTLPSFATGFVRFNLVKNAQAFTRWLQTNLARLEAQHGWRLTMNYYGSSLDSSSRRTLEGRLSLIMNRKTDDYAAMPEVEALYADARPTLFLLIATPVIEVGRDYDFDFAILEPCSDMSIIQAAGRVRRHRRTEAPTSENVSLMPVSCRGVSTGGRQGACLYGHPGPGVEQTDPVAGDRWRLPKGKRAPELFGLDHYARGIHAGYRLHDPTTVADRLERQQQAAVLLSEEPLSLVSFADHPCPFRDTHFDEIGFRAQQEPGYHYEWKAGAFQLIGDDTHRVQPKMVEWENPGAFFIKLRLEKNTTLECRNMMDSKTRYSPFLGVEHGSD